VEWTQVLCLMAVMAASYYVGFARGVFFALRRAKELIEELEIEQNTPQQEQQRVALCRAELIGDVMYLYQQKEGTERFLAQGSNLEQLIDNVKARMGEIDIQVKDANDAERAWFKQFGKGL
jgi:hypothetical protein